MDFDTPSEGKAIKICDEDAVKEYIIFNETDGIPAAPTSFPSREDAEKFVKDFPSRFKPQGFYLTSNYERINPQDVQLTIYEVDSDD